MSLFTYVTSWAQVPTQPLGVMGGISDLGLGQAAGFQGTTISQASMAARNMPMMGNTDAQHDILSMYNNRSAMRPLPFRRTSNLYLQEGDTVDQQFAPVYLSIKLDTARWKRYHRMGSGTWVHRGDTGILRLTPYFNTELLYPKARTDKKSSGEAVNLENVMAGFVHTESSLAYRLSDSFRIYEKNVHALVLEYDINDIKNVHTPSKTKFCVVASLLNQEIAQSFVLELMGNRDLRHILRARLQKLVTSVTQQGRIYNFSDPFFKSDSVVLLKHRPLRWFSFQSGTFSIKEDQYTPTPSLPIEADYPVIQRLRLNTGDFPKYIHALRIAPPAEVATGNVPCFVPEHSILFYKDGQIAARYMVSLRCRTLVKWMNGYLPSMFMIEQMKPEQWKAWKAITAAFGE